jgi:hypothetical protein
MPGSEKFSNMKNDLENDRASKETESLKDILATFKEDMPSQCGVCGSGVEVVSNPITSTVITYCPPALKKKSGTGSLIRRKP